MGLLPLSRAGPERTVSAVEFEGGDGSVHGLKKATISKDWDIGGGKGEGVFQGDIDKKGATDK